MSGFVSPRLQLEQTGALAADQGQHTLSAVPTMESRLTVLPRADGPAKVPIPVADAECSRISICLHNRLVIGSSCLPPAGRGSCVEATRMSTHPARAV